MTNLEKLRSMGKTELAGFLEELLFDTEDCALSKHLKEYCKSCLSENKGTCPLETEERCKYSDQEMIIDWLDNTI